MFEQLRYGLLWQKLAAQGVKPEQVTGIYSELQPCSIPGGYCASRIAGTFPQADVTWSFQSGPSLASREVGLAELEQALARLFGRG
jgi:hypothetical protein